MVVLAPKCHGDPKGRKVQIQNNGRNVKKNFNTFPRISDYAHSFDRIISTTKAMAPVFEKARQESSLFRFALRGADGLPGTDDSVCALEFNTFPNMVNDPQEDPVYVPLLSSAILISVAGINDNFWVRIV